MNRGGLMTLRSMIERDEGREKIAYPDPLTHGEPWTIGIGHTGPEVHRGLVWTDEQIDAAYDVDAAEATAGCRQHFAPWFDLLAEPRQAVLIAMAFQMGLPRLLGFVRMLGAVRDQRYAHAAEEMRNSTWARQTPIRCTRMAYQMEMGQWQYASRAHNPEMTDPAWGN